MKFGVALLVASSVVAAQPSVALAFGTISTFGQHQEHERITRRALGCKLNPGVFCFQARSLDALAGSAGHFGAVGAPDKPTNHLLDVIAAHCDAGDYYSAVKDYPHNKMAALDNLKSCRKWMVEHLKNASDYAINMLALPGDNLNAYDKHPPIDTTRLTVDGTSCHYSEKFYKHSAKCFVLQEFGLTLHAAQDFYSHSNWVDTKKSGKIEGIYNPPGLGKGPVRADWLNLRDAAPAFPDGLMTGCFSKAELSGLVSKGKCAGRVPHLYLNKDKGEIGDNTIGAGTTRRGKVDSNFKNAVLAAIDDTEDKWATLREKIIMTWGVENGGKLICAIVKDAPTDQDCTDIMADVKTEAKEEGLSESYSGDGKGKHRDKK